MRELLVLIGYWITNYSEITHQIPRTDTQIDRDSLLRYKENVLSFK